MKTFAIFSVLIIAITACSNQNESLVQENEALKTEIAAKNKSLMAFDDYVQSVQIRFKEVKRNHKILDANLLKNNEKDVSYTLLQDIRLIDEWMIALEKQVADGRYAIAEAGQLTEQKHQELNAMLRKLSIKQDELLASRADVAKLAALLEDFDNQICERDELIQKQEENLNRVYFAFGSNDELIKSGVAGKKKGFLGKRKQVELKSDFDTAYFTHADKRQLKEITVKSNDAALLSSHPEGSYEWVGEDTVEIFRITDPDLFWRNTSYLAMAVK